MPMLIEHIDAIARKQQRDVLYLTFHLKNANANGFQERKGYDYNDDPVRNKICGWLTEHNMRWQPCGHIASETMMMSYRGQIYLDVPFDDNDPTYLKVRDYLEHPDGTMGFPTVSFWYLTLEKALENAHHDEPGFWEHWADNF